ncbi:MAG TPA: fibronectin type III domain-containing protein [Gemmataceae bacterium]|jgi:fibronectin type 3 domain-containing protein|nr:fibronectin type III domain-containing protein [Gemmataceae bacterium]
MLWFQPTGTRKSWAKQPVVEILESRLAPATDILSFRAGSGVNDTETELAPNNLANGDYGKIAAITLDGQVYGQPLIKTGVTIANGPNTRPGVAGVHDIVVVATQHDSVFAVDANAGTILWSRSFLDVAVPTNNTLGASTISTVPAADTGSTDISPEVGITSTPVIDGATNTVFVVAKTKEIINGTAHYAQRLHAINLADGTDRAFPYLFGETILPNVNNTPIYTYGNGDGAIIDPYNGTGRPVVQFNALRENQRAALSLVNGRVYISWASHGDNGPFHGLVVAIDVSNLASNGLVLSGVFNASPNNALAGIWQGAGQLAFEPNGSAFYFETGNGTGGAPTTLDAAGLPADGNFNEALVKVVLDPTTSATHQNVNGWGMKAVDYFIPYNVAALDGADSDFGSGAPIILPDSAGIPGHPHLLVAGGKEGKLYILDRDHLGHFDAVNDNALNSVPNGSGHNTPPMLLNGLFSTPIWFDDKLYATSGLYGQAFAYSLDVNGHLTATSQTEITSFGALSGSPMISANGTANGIVWLLDRQTNRIHAYDAATLATELWNSARQPDGLDTLGTVTKFSVPSIANGHVYVGTLDGLVLYGHDLPPENPPLPPVLSAATLSGSSIKLTWTDATPPRDQATIYTIEESLDDSSFNAITTVPAGATSISVGGLQPFTHYYFRIRGSNSLGSSSPSNVADASTADLPPLVDFFTGFANPADLSVNLPAAISGDRLRITSGAFNAGTAFTANRVDVTSFSSRFTFQLTNAVADGFTFAIQGNGPTVEGIAGGDLGYGGIANSVAIKFDLFDNAGEGYNSTGLYVGGASPTNVGSTDLGALGLNLHSGDVFRVDVSYDASQLRVTITDTATNVSATQNYSVDIPSLVGGNSAYVGFTGGTGSLIAIQDILNWTYSAGARFSPNAPSGLGAVPVTATSVHLSWVSNPSMPTGYHLDRATDANFTQNLITQVVPPNPNSFTDAASGLTPGATYYYRLRAFNSAGESGNSNVAAVTIPVAPPTPTNMQVKGVTATSIDLSWTDNAGHAAQGYRILRAENNGTFSEVDTLPPTSRTPPSTYEWSDVRLTPNTIYTYHVLAFNSSGSNDFVGVTLSTLNAEPSAPTGLTASSGVNSAIPTTILTWNATPGATSYNVYRSRSSGGEGSVAIATGLAAPTFVDSAVVFGTTYFYQVTAVNAIGESPRTVETHATALFSAHINFTSVTGDSVPGYLADTGAIFGVRSANLKFGWTRNDQAWGINRNASNSPDELHDSFHDMRAGTVGWHIAVPNGTYRVHLIAGDPMTTSGPYRLNVGPTSTTTNAAIRGNATAAQPWVENNIEVTVTTGVLWIRNAGGVSNRVAAIVVTQVLTGVNLANGFASSKMLAKNGSTRVLAGALRLTGAAAYQSGNAFTTTPVSVAGFQTSFDFRLTNAHADGFAFVMQGIGPRAKGIAGRGLGYVGIDRSVALTFDLFDNAGEGANAVGVFRNGQFTDAAGSSDLTGDGIDLHSGHTMHVDVTYSGGILTLMLKDKDTGATATRAFTVDIVGTVGASQAYVGFTGATGGQTAIQEILNWNYSPTP